MMKNPKLYMLLCLSFVVLIAAWLLYPSGTNSADAALAEYQIEKLTCGSCVSKIEKALSGLDGVGISFFPVTDSQSARRDAATGGKSR